VEPDPVLRRVKAVLTHPIGDYAVQPREATFAAHGITMAHYMDGAAYTVGPTQNISIRSSSLVRELGGEVLVDATVQEIILEHGRAVGVRVINTSSAGAEGAGPEEKGSPPVSTEIRAKNVVCATSIYNLYNKLLPQDHPVVKEFQDPSKRKVRQSNGHVFLFCKIQGDADQLGVPKHNLWYFNDYDLDQAFDRYFANPREVRPPTVYIGFPCTKDPTWKKRFPNVSNCILISDGLWEWFQAWEGKPVHNRGKDYEEFKQDLSKHLLDILYESVPQVKGKVEFSELGTPLSEVTYLSSFHGGSYGTKCTTELLASEWTTTPHTKIPGLYMAGSDAFLPAVCGAMYGGCFGAAAVLGHMGTFRMALNILADFASSLNEENPKLSWPSTYLLACQKFMTDA
jgi:all-trans-retinol 13,14-reductase